MSLRLFIFCVAHEEKLCRTGRASRKSGTGEKPTKQVPTGRLEPYSLQQAINLFHKYAETDDSNVIGPTGFETLCNDAGIAMDGVVPLLLSWQLEATEMGRITKNEWENFTSELQ